MVVTTGKVHETRISPSIQLKRDDVAIFDRAYIDFRWFKALDDKGVYFVTRTKRNAQYRVVERKDVSRFKNILSDQIIKLKGFYSKQKYPDTLRRIRSKNPETGKIITILTNNFIWQPTTIAKIYKGRWQIELFFKCIKQQLKVKSFVGTSKNALLSQLWVALIAYLLLSYLKFRSRFNWSLYTLCSILPANIFARRNLWDWLNAPFHDHSKAPPEVLQQEFSFS